MFCRVVFVSVWQFSLTMRAHHARLENATALQALSQISHVSNKVRGDPSLWFPWVLPAMVGPLAAGAEAVATVWRINSDQRFDMQRKKKSKKADAAEDEAALALEMSARTRAKAATSAAELLLSLVSIPDNLQTLAQAFGVQVGAEGQASECTASSCTCTLTHSIWLAM
jgi:ABC-type transporter Mla MlaB component